MASSSIVIKVKYGDTLRRFNALVDENQHLDLDMERLRTKICSLFNLTPDTDFSLIYIDEDDDQVTLADDDDLYDVMRQGLNPVRITVHLNVDKSAQSSPKSTGSSTLRRSSSQNSQQDKKPRVTDILKSVPEPISDALSKLSLELASKAASTSPVLADLINNLSKMGLPYLNTSHPPTSTTTVTNHEIHDDHQNPSAGEKQSATVNEGIKPGGGQGSTSEQPTPISSQVSGKHVVEGAKQLEPLRPPQQSPSLLNKGKNAGHFHYMPIGDAIKKDKEIIGESTGKCKDDSFKLPTSDSRKMVKETEGNSSGRSGANAYEYMRSQMEGYFPCKEMDESKYPMGNCPYSGVPLQPDLGQASYMPPRIQPFSRIFKHSADDIGSIFHKGVRCDGCGVLPITGPRFKSIVKRDYDLCSICFARMGNDGDYARIDYPLPYRHPWIFKGFHDPMTNQLPSVQIPSKRPCGAKQFRFRFDSRFIMDINVMDGTLMAPLTPFTKIWRMRNNGTLPWIHGLQLLWIGGDRFSASDSVVMEVPVEGVGVGNEIDIAADFIAPELPGSYISYWRMADASGRKFGQRVWVLIQVDPTLNGSKSESSPVLKSDLPPGKAGPSTSESSLVVDLNLPPENAIPLAHKSSPFTDLNVDVNVEYTRDAEADDPCTASERGKQSMFEENREIEFETEEMNFPINDDLLVTSDETFPVYNNPAFPVTSPLFYPKVDANIQQTPASDVPSSFITVSSSTPSPNSTGKPPYTISSVFPYPVANINTPHIPASAYPSVSYPTVEVFDEPLFTPLAPAENESANHRGEVHGSNELEETLLKELEEMGFKDVDLNKEVLRMNEYDLEQSVDELCSFSGWDHILDELREMGFQDKETNRKLLAKNNGSIMRVVLDLIAGEKA